MLFYDLLAEKEKHSREPALVAWDHAATWQQMARAVERAVRWLEPVARQRIGFRFSPSAGGFAALAALDFHNCDTTLLAAEIDAAAADELARELEFETVVTAAAGEDPTRGTLEARTPSGQPAEPGVTLLTSGTEGRAKAVRHTWDSLARPVRGRSDDSKSTWLLAYRPQLYAGLQVILQCFSNRDCLVVPKIGATVPDVVGMIVEHRVQCLSATPSYWRRLLLFSDDHSWRGADLRQITLGGEIVDQQILDALHQRFPAARIVHIFATTELGRCFAIGDGRAGFPVELLDKTTPDGVSLQVRAGVLWVRSANAMRKYNAHSPSGDAEIDPTDWFCTGDLVDVVGDRILFAGRHGDTINVGGNKVQPIHVENVLRRLSEVADVRVYGVESSLTGQLVACQAVPAHGVSESCLRAAIQETATRQLRSHERPRFIEVSSQIELTNAGKVSRNESSQSEPSVAGKGESAPAKDA